MSRYSTNELYFEKLDKLEKTIVPFIGLDSYILENLKVYYEKYGEDIKIPFLLRSEEYPLNKIDSTGAFLVKAIDGYYLEFFNESYASKFLNFCLVHEKIEYLMDSILFDGFLYCKLKRKAFKQLKKEGFRFSEFEGKNKELIKDI